MLKFKELFSKLFSMPKQVSNFMDECDKEFEHGGNRHGIDQRMRCDICRDIRIRYMLTIQINKKINEWILMATATRGGSAEDYLEEIEKLKNGGYFE